MRISKWYLVVCAAAFCGSMVTVRADNTPAQAAALAAMEAKMGELNAQSASTNAPQNSTPAMPEQSAHAPAMTAPATPAPAEKPAMTTRPSSNRGLFAPVPPPSGSMSAGPTTANNMQPSKAGQTSPPVTVPPSFFTRSSQSTNAFYPGKLLHLKPITAPPPPVSPAQVAQLQALLEKYDANAITPEQYQAERAKIMAEHK